MPGLPEISKEPREHPATAFAPLSFTGKLEPLSLKPTDRSRLRLVFCRLRWWTLLGNQRRRCFRWRRGELAAGISCFLPLRLFGFYASFCFRNLTASSEEDWSSDVHRRPWNSTMILAYTAVAWILLAGIAPDRPTHMRRPWQCAEILHAPGSPEGFVKLYLTEF